MEYTLNNNDIIHVGEKTYTVSGGALLGLPITDISEGVVIDAVTSAYKVSMRNIRSSKRETLIAEARQALCYYLYKSAELTLCSIGKLVNRHHSTVISHIRSYGFLRREYKTTRYYSDMIEDKLNIH